MDLDSLLVLYVLCYFTVFTDFCITLLFYLVYSHYVLLSRRFWYYTIDTVILNVIVILHGH